ncbi:MAG: F0F1 ATP synthase subunit epsilon, partial [Candidatus Rokuibacteriota bacterium]
MAEPRVRFELATPNRLVVSEDVDEVVAPGLQGYFGVLPGHVPFLTSLQSGEVSYRIGRTEQYLAVSGGFAEVQGDRVTILAERAERPEEIDRERAERARQRAERRLQGKTQEEID